jgi:hypothetical protein
VALDVADAFSDYMAADDRARRDHRNAALVVGAWLVDNDLAGRWDMIDFADLANRLHGSRRERGLFWIAITGILVFMGQVGLLPTFRAHGYLDIILDLAPDDPTIRSLMCAGQAVLTDTALN